MLRARFQLDKFTGSWSQLIICKPEDSIYRFASLQVNTVTDVENNLAERHQELNIAQGKVLRGGSVHFEIWRPVLDTYRAPSGGRPDILAHYPR
jgi:hypothetical protein